MNTVELEKIKKFESTNDTKMSNNWHPKMGDYPKNNTEEDIKVIRKKILKNNLLISGLVFLLVGILAIAIIFFLNQ